MNTKTFLKLTGAIALAACFSAPVQATPITGSIAFGGLAIAKDASNTSLFTNLSTAVSVQFNSSVVLGTTDDFNAIPTLTSVPQTNFTFLPTFSAVIPLWTHAGSTFSFNLNSLTNIVRTPTSITLDGTGVFTHSTLDDTDGTWHMTINPFSQSQLSFSSGSSTVPEPLSLSLLGIGIATLAAKRKAQLAQA
jgi:PEP-CTERM motif